MISNFLLSIPLELSPEIFSIGPVTFRYYGLFWALSFALGYYVTKKTFLKDGAPEAWLDSFLLLLVGFSLLGARLGHVMFYHPQMFWENPAGVLMFWKGGMASHGGFIGMTIAFWAFGKYISRKPLLWGSDRVVMSTAVAAGLIRLGNFVNQEIYGIASNLPWAVEFRLRGEFFGRHPAQLYEAICYFLIAGLLFFPVLEKGLWKPHGSIDWNISHPHFHSPFL